MYAQIAQPLHLRQRQNLKARRWMITAARQRNMPSRRFCDKRCPVQNPFGEETKSFVLAVLEVKMKIKIIVLQIRTETCPKSSIAMGK